MNRIIKTYILLFFLGFAWQAEAHIDPNRQASPSNNENINYREDCVPARAQIDQDINNVRARLLTGGDVWWDLQEGRYIVPKQEPGSGITEVSSIFAGSVWLGGFDPVGNLKVAAGDYRTGGVDFYPGPLDPETGLTDLEFCNDWDQFFEVQGNDILDMIALYDNGIAIIPDSVPDGVRYWPGRGNADFASFYDFELPNTGQGLGSFWDEDGSGLYEPENGDFPIIEIRGCLPDNREEASKLVPDEMIFWIYNDAGGPHGLSQGEKIQMEVQVQSFGYATNDELNDMTFQRYKLINRAESDIRDAYFAMWVDPDLGCFTDDYIGCNVERSLMYVYNEDVLDGTTGCNCDQGTPTYCDRVPILGVDYFRGPRGPKIINIDENGDTVYTNPPIGAPFDTLIELGMSSFMYLNNCSVGDPDPITCDPGQAEGYYNVLTGLWPNGTPVTVGGSGLNIGSADSTRYTFPDAPNNSQGWSMCTADLAFGDRRTIQASGPFLLKPGFINELIVGVPWVPDIVYPCPDISRLLAADDLAQAVFDNCFDIPRGPDAPDVCMIELDREIILVLSNDTIRSNNAFENYEEEDILAPETAEDNTYNFEGYQIFQLANSGVSAQEFNDIEKAKLIRQVDVKNGVTEIYNWTATVNPASNLGDLVYEYERQVSGADEGIAHTFRITEDEFADGDRTLVNHKKYYYSVVAYAHNEFEIFEPTTGLGQKAPYRVGRKNIMTYTATPRPIVYENLNSFYGDGPRVFRLDGVGSGDVFMELADGVHDQILNGETIEKLEYKDGQGPIDVKIFNPLDVVDGTYELKVNGEFIPGGICELQDSATWTLTHLDSGTIIESEKSLDEVNEQVISQYGFSIQLAQSDEPGTNVGDQNGFIGAEFEYEDPTGLNWFFGIADEGRNFVDEDGEQLFQGFEQAWLDFIKTDDGQPDFDNDRLSSYSEVAGGTWYPFWLCDYRDHPNPNVPFYITPAWRNNDWHNLVRGDNGLFNLNNVDIVFTNDKSKWSRCVVVETASEDYLSNWSQNPDNLLPYADRTVGDTKMFDLRLSPSKDKDGNDESGEGMSWFPGYAIDVETGDRLNIFFGENSIFGGAMIDSMWLQDNVEVGRDMLFNPSSQLASPILDVSNLIPRMAVIGGGHSIYVTRQKYDECASIKTALDGGTLDQRDALRSITWSSMVMMPDNNTALLSYQDGVIPNDLTVKLRVNNKYNLQKEFILDESTSCTTVGGNPKYEFVIENKAATELADDQKSDALAKVNAVPNPYFGYSSYETSQFTKTIKITNLPERCKVTIYSLDGKFVREFDRDERETIKGVENGGTSVIQAIPDLQWDLNNYAGIPVASGVYIIHINAEELGEERTIKWFGVNREFDPSGL